MSNTHFTIRSVRPGDENLMRRLAQLDSAPALSGHPLIAEVDGEAVAAYSPEEDRAVADPFRHTAAAVELLEARARLLAGAASRKRRVARRSVRLPA
jgi:hypothetical protein